MYHFGWKIAQLENSIVGNPHFILGPFNFEQTAKAHIRKTEQK